MRSTTEMKYLAAAFLLISCREEKVTVDVGDVTEGTPSVDADGDGYINDEDCDDNEGTTHPGAIEICDGIDNNCNGEIDEGVGETFYADMDADGFGNDSETLEACEAPENYIPVGNDCDDQNPSVNPAAAELCDGIDNNCDGITDDANEGNWYPDLDGDGFGESSGLVVGCSPGDDYVQLGGDCDDTNPEVNPLGVELCDNIDNDCDSEIDEGVGMIFYADNDQDGFGSPDQITEACEIPAGHSENNQDCDDTDSMVNPDSAEYCDQIDNNCDGQIDDSSAVDQLPFYADTDADGFGDPDQQIMSCNAPSGYVSDYTDCDDTSPDRNPGATEQCNLMDDDCDNLVDESLPLLDWFADNDNDGFGNANNVQQNCAQPTGYVMNDQDCDDSSPNVNPLNAELCNGFDDNCDGNIDGPGSVDALTWYIDLDSDGYGSLQFTTLSCTQPGGWVDNSDDCDDNEASVNPGATELCNGIDDDCDGVVDTSSMNAMEWFLDSDCDGHGDPNNALIACEAPQDYVETGDDCDDSDPRVHPGAEEICLSSGPVDHDCDGIADNACETVIEIQAPSHSPVDNPQQDGACSTFADLYVTVNSHTLANLPLHMAELESSGPNLSTISEVSVLDYSARYGTNYTASPGNFPTTQPWGNIGTGYQGAARFRGYIHIGCGEKLNKTLGFIGNDALKLIIEGQDVLSMHWDDGQWKKFRHISFPEPGLYAFEVQWSTNFCCDIDPLEVVWADGFLPGYNSYDNMCAWSSCVYNNGQIIPGFSAINSSAMLQSSDGSQTDCTQCDNDTDCDSSQTCNSAGICETAF